MHFILNLEDVPESGGIVVALPLKIDGPEAETRVAVICPKDV